MKRFRISILLIGLIACICVAFTACFPYVGGGGTSDVQSQEESVSEAMLMYREAVAAGYTGTYLEFLDEYFKSSNPPTVGDSSTVISDDECNRGADLAALSAVKIESTYAFRNTGSIVDLPRYATEYGSGVIFSLDRDNWDAYILTNYHVIYEYSSYGNETVPHVSDNINVWLFGGQTEREMLTAKFVGGAIDYDVAVLFIDGSKTVYESAGTTHTNASVLKNSDVRAITIGNSDDVTVGDAVFAIGNPVGMGISVTQGIVSLDSQYITMLALNSSVRTVDFLEMRIDAAVNHGNSGGGLFNSRGEYIGTVNARDEGEGIRDFGYAIPSNLTVAIAHNVIAARSGGVLFINLGITAEILSSRSVYDEETGQVHTVQSIGVAGVDSHGALAEILHEGDVLLSVTYGGVKKAITREYQLTFLSFNLRAGTKVEFEVLREGENLTLSVDLVNSHFESVH